MNGMNNNINNGGFPYYTNPYSQTQQQQQQDQQQPPSNNPYAASSTAASSRSSSSSSNLDDLLNTLERSGLDHVTLNLQNLQKHVVSSGNSQRSSSNNRWSVSQVLRFTEWVLSTTKILEKQQKQQQSKQQPNNNNNDTQKQQQQFAAILAALSTVVSSWSSNSRTVDDNLLLVYAAVTFASDENSYGSSSSSNSNKRETTSASNSPQRRTLLTVLEQALCWSSGENNSTSAAVRYTALTAFSAIWTALDRLQQHCDDRISYNISNDDTVWWIPASTTAPWISAAIDGALQGLVLRQDDWQATMAGIVSDSTTATTSGAGLCEFKTCCASILQHLLQHGVSDWLYTSSNTNNQQQQQRNNSPNASWARKLLQESSRLNDANMPGSVYCQFSLQCLRLLVTLQSCGGGGDAFSDPTVFDDWKRFLQSTPILAHISRAVCSGTDALPDTNINSSNAPRWTQLADAETVQLSTALLQDLYRASPANTGEALSQQESVRNFLLYGWNVLLASYAGSSSNNNRSNLSQTQRQQQKQSLSNHHLERIIFLHTACRQVARETLREVMMQMSTPNLEDASRCLLSTLLDWIRNHHSLPSATLLQVLLADRLDPVRHDELSRCLWKAAATTEPFSVNEQCLKLIVELASTNTSLADYHRAVLLALLDAAYILVRAGGDESNSAILSSLSADSVEALVQVVTPKQACCVNMSTTMDQSRNLLMDDDDDEDEETPPANNLSRLDSSVIVMEEQERLSRGIDPAVRQAAATFLAVLASCCNSGTEGTASHVPNLSLLRGRMVDAATSFVSDLQLSFSSVSVSSGQDDRRNGPASLRMTRRRLRLLTLLATADNEEYLAGLIHAADVSQRKVTTDLQRRLDRSNESLREYRKTEQRLQAEKDGCVSRLTAQALQFQREKSEVQRNMARNAQQSAELHAAERQKAEQRARELSSHMAEAQQTARASREAEAQVRQSLEQVTHQLEQVSAREQDLVQRAERSESDLQRVSGELQTTKASLHDISAKEKDMRQRVKEQEDQIVDLESSDDQLRHSLENLFGDMVSLARLYEIQEKKLSASRETEQAQLERLQRELQAERQRVAELEEQEQRTQMEKEVLTKKYARAKDKLEKEREERRKEQVAASRNNGTSSHHRHRGGGGHSGISYFNQLHTVDRSRGGGKENSTSRSSSRSRGGTLRR